LEKTYVSISKTIQKNLDLTDITYINDDVLDIPLQDGDVFFMFTPFTGIAMGRVIEKLEKIGNDKRIHICSFGNSTIELAKQSWLKPIENNMIDPYKAAVFKNSGETYDTQSKT
jgi:hypothetical protein